ncbi:hypothetical protein Tco_1341262 [Tanacetum coccineum]
MNNTTRTNFVLPAGITFVLPVLTITVSLPVGTTYLPARTFTLPVGTTYLLVVTIYYKIPNIVVDYFVDPRVLLILGRPFLWTTGALIDVYSDELTLRVDNEAITFKVGQTSRYSYNDVMSINRIDVIDVACEEYAQEVFRFLDSSASGNPTPSLDHILSTFPHLSLLLREGDLLLLEKLLNDDPSSSLPPIELHVEELKIIKSSIDDPPELELKDLPSHLQYAFLEGTDKLPVIIVKNLKKD